MSPQEVDATALRLFEAERSGVQTGLISLAHPQAGMDDAYRIQAAFVARKMAAGRTRIGWKIGLTSRAMQSALNIDIPDSGVLLDDMLFANGATIPRGRFIQPRVAAEIALVMKTPLQGSEIGVADVLAATDYLLPSLEILDTRILRVDPETRRARTLVDTVSDNAANAGIVLGDFKLDPAASDLRWMGAIVLRDGVVEETGLGAGVLNHPAAGVAWLANRLALYGQSLAAGDIVLSGSFIRPLEALPGSTILADFGPHGIVQVHF